MKKNVDLYIHKYCGHLFVMQGEECQTYVQVSSTEEMGKLRRRYGRLVGGRDEPRTPPIGCKAISLGLLRDQSCYCCLGTGCCCCGGGRTKDVLEK